MLKKSRRVAIPVVLLITLLLTTSVVNAASSWSIVTSPSPGFSINILKATATISKSDVWAVGTADLSGVSGLNQTLTEHWNGTSWKTVKSPDAGTQSKNFLNGVAAVSTSNVWAVGYYFNSATEQTLVEHWNGTSWKIVKSPNVGTENSVLQGVVAVSANDVWAVVQTISVGDNSDISPSRLTFPLEAPYASFSEGSSPFTSFQAKRFLHEPPGVLAPVLSRAALCSLLALTWSCPVESSSQGAHQAPPSVEAPLARRLPGLSSRLHCPVG